MVATADSLSDDTIFRDISGLKAEVGKMLTTMSDRLEQEVGRYDAVKRAIAEKQQELAEIYEIQKAASSLAALIEAQNQKKEEFEADMAARKEILSREIEEMRIDWQKEKAQRAAEQREQKEQDAVESRKRSREKEDYDYALQREQTDREFSEREQAIVRQEQELADLRARVAAFPKEMETTVAGEVKAAVEKVQTEGKFRLEIVQKEFEGERNILQGRIASLETVLNDQSAHLIKLNDQVEKSYSQVQAIAVKAVRARRRRLLQLFSRSSSRGNSSSVGHVEHLKRDRFDAGSRLERLSVMVLPTVVMDGGEWPEL